MCFSLRSQGHGGKGSFKDPDPQCRPASQACSFKERVPLEMQAPRGSQLKGQAVNVTDQPPLHRPRCTRESERAENSAWRMGTGGQEHRSPETLRNGGRRGAGRMLWVPRENSEDTVKRDFTEKIGCKTRLCFLRKCMKTRVSCLPHSFALR